MIRLMAALAVFLGLAFAILGADHGQNIHDGVAAVVPATVAVKAPVRQVFIPAQPVVQVAQPELSVGVPETAVPAVPAQAVEVAPDAVPADAVPVDASAVEPTVESPVDFSTGKLMHAPGGANVRSGPGGTYPVVKVLANGDGVLAAEDATAPGWMRVAVERDGTTGWVAAKLLRE